MLETISVKFRQMNGSSDLFSQSFSDLIEVELSIMETSKTKIYESMVSFEQTIWQFEMVILVINVLTILLAIIAIQIGLSFYRDRIVNTQSLLKIIPTKIVMKKQESMMLGNQLSIFMGEEQACLLYTSPSPRDLSISSMPSSA